MRNLLIVLSVVLQTLSFAGENSSKLDEEFPRMGGAMKRFANAGKDAGYIVLDYAAIVQLDKMSDRAALLAKVNVAMAERLKDNRAFASTLETIRTDLKLKQSYSYQAAVDTALTKDAYRKSHVHKGFASLGKSVIYKLGKYYFVMDAMGRVVNIAMLEQRDTGYFPGTVPVGAAKVLWSEFSKGFDADPRPHAEVTSEATKSTEDYKARLSTHK